MSNVEVLSAGIPVVTPPLPTVAPVEERVAVVMPDFATSPVVGHGAVFTSWVECSAALLHKRGQIVVLMGNRGLGKSRLKRVFQAHFNALSDTEGVLWLEGGALSYSEQMSYCLLAQVVRQVLSLPAKGDIVRVGTELQAWCALFLGEDAVETTALPGFAVDWGATRRSYEAGACVTANGRDCV